EVSELPRSLSCAFEPLRYTSITVNGSDVAPSGGWWYDRSFQRAEILPFIHKGKNIITFCLDYFQRDYVYYVLYGGVSESLRNCLCFDTEIECVYLFGEFSVKMDKSKFTYGERHSVCYNGTFAIEPAKKEIDVRDIVIDGYPFFGGTVELETTLKYTEGDPSVLRLRGRYATAEIYVKGKHASSLLFSDTVNLKPYLKHGENILTVKLTNANRNLMGPHHRPDPEPYGVGPNTFSYEKEWKDGTCAQFLPRYAFVRFGIDL
ncbi:MAG: hypothetical protein GX633_05000, partial [Clostridiales bacterium]|nr:hypothetical protein [Clostridiales bacterium]